MIHRWIKDQLQTALPAYQWSINYYSGDKDTGTVYEEQGVTGNVSDESGFRFPAYMIYLRGKNWTQVEHDIQTARKILDRRFNELTENIRIDFLHCLEPIRVGRADDEKMEYSLNINATIREV